MRIGTVTCAICDAANNGEYIPPAIQRQMRNPVLQIPFSDLNYDPMFERSVSPKEAVELASTNKYYSRVVTAIRDKIVDIKEVIVEKIPESLKIARSKRTSRVFDLPIDSE